MNYYVEIHKNGIRTYTCTFGQMLSSLGLECLTSKRTIRADVMEEEKTVKRDFIHGVMQTR